METRLIYDQADPEYRKVEAYSNSFGNVMRSKTPAHARYERLNPSGPTPAMIFGTLVHMAVLEPARFAKEVVVGPNVSKATKEWKEFAAKNASATLIKADEMQTIQDMLGALSSHPVASEILFGQGKSEVSALWEQQGVQCKARFDHLIESMDVLADLKTTTDASPKAFSKACANLGYHRQSALYLDAYEAITGRQTNKFLHILVEKEPPYAVAVYVLDDGALEKGRYENAELLATYKQCVETGIWPGFAEQITAATLPHWAFQEE